MPVGGRQTHHTSTPPALRRLVLPGAPHRVCRLPAELTLCAMPGENWSECLPSSGSAGPTDLTEYSPSTLWSAGTLISTVHDLNSFFRALADGKLLPAYLLREMRTMRAMGSDRPGRSYGLGLKASVNYCRTRSPVWGHKGRRRGRTGPQRGALRLRRWDGPGEVRRARRRWVSKARPAGEGGERAAGPGGGFLRGFGRVPLPASPGRQVRFWPKTEQLFTYPLHSLRIHLMGCHEYCRGRNSMAIELPGQVVSFLQFIGVN